MKASLQAKELSASLTKENAVHLVDEGAMSMLTAPLGDSPLRSVQNFTTVKENWLKLQ